MPGWWDAITPWDTENEKKQREAEAKAKEAAAKRAAGLQRAQATRDSEPLTRRDLVNEWAKTAKPTIKPAAPIVSDRLRDQPAAPTVDPVQQWRDSASQRAPLYDVQPPSFDIGPERVDTGAAPIQSSAPINQTMGPPQGPARQQQPPAAWNAFSNAMDDWALKPIGAATQALGVNDALNRAGSFMGEDVPDWYTSQPSFIKAQADDEWRRREGSNEGYDAFLDTAGQFMDQAFTVPAKSLLNAPIPGSGGALGLPADVGVSDMVGAFGGMLNQSGLNPLNPNKRAYSDMQKAMWAQTSGEQGFYEASGMKQNLEQAAKNRMLIDALPDELRTQASMALSSTISGAKNVANAIDQILGQSERVQSLYQLAQQAQTQGDALGAAEYSRQADELKNKSARDFVDDNTNIWAEILEGVILDPTNLVGPALEAAGLSNEAMTATKNLQLFDMTPEEAQQAISSAMPQVQKIADSINMGEMGKGWWARVSPFALTADSAAHSSSNNIFRTASVLFGSVTDKAEALAMAQNLVTNPAVLVAEGAAGPGLLANPDFLRDLPILHVAQEQIQNMRSLAGEGAFNAVEFLSELDNIVYQTARRANGLDDLMALPTGAKSLKLRRTQDGTGFIDYLGKDGKLISSSEEMPLYNAEQELKALNKAMSNQGGGMTLLRAHDQVQRAIMSDLWLNMRPAHWVRNALSATTTLLADNLYTLRPTDDIIEGLSARFGGAVPTQRLAEGAGGVQEMTGQSIFRKWGPLFAPLAAAAEGGAKIWSGNTTLLGTGGRVAFGEQNFYLRAFSQPFERFLNKNWAGVVSGELTPVLETLGIDPAMAKRLQDIAVDAGITGNKASIAGALRSAVNKATISPNLRELGIAPDAFSLDAWKKINDLIQDGVPENVTEIAQQVGTIVRQETDRLTRLVNAAPPQPLRYAWTEAEQVEDGADMIDSLAQAARRAGIDPEQAKQEASTFVQQVINAERQALETFRTELATNDNPSALNVAVDLWGQIDELKRVARAKVDELGAAASTANTPDLWQRKWQETQKIYTDLSSYVQRTIDQARTDVLAIEGGREVPRRYDFWNMVDRYLAFDELTTREARLGGMDLKAPSADPAWRQVVEANRAYVDASTAEAFQAFRRYASTDALDIVASAQKNIDRLGAQAAGYLAEMREQLAMGMISKDRYYGIRNTVWGQMFDNAVLVNKAATWEIVQDGLAKQTETMLRWTDEFAGGEFKLVAPGADGIWTAKRLDDSTIHQFADPTRGKPGDVSSMPRVPQEVVNDYYRVVGEADKIVEQEVADIVAEVAQTIPIPQTLDELMAMIKAGTAPPDELIPPALIDQMMTGDARDRWRVVPASSIPDATAQAQAVFDAAKVSRESLRDEWDRVAKASGLANNIDQVIAAYTREGIVNVPERTFEDLYGTTIAGQRIDNSRDVEAFLQDYYNLNQQARQAIASTGVNVNELRRAASEAGIATIGKGNRPNDKWLLNTLNKELGVKVKSLRELTPEQYQQAMDVLAKRAAARVPAAAAPIVEQAAPAVAKAVEAAAPAADEAAMSAEELASYRTLDRSVVASMFRPDLRDLGYTDVQIGRMSSSEMVDALQGSGPSASSVILPKPRPEQVARNQQQGAEYLQAAAKKLKLSPDEVVSRARANFIKEVQGKPIEIQTSVEHFDQVSETGRYRNMFEANRERNVKGRDLRDDYMRLQAEQGIPADVPGADRPIFSAVLSNDVIAAEAQVYGGVRLRLKDSVKGRVAYVPADTHHLWVADGFTVLPTTDINKVDESFFGPVLEDWAIGGRHLWGDDSRVPYVESYIYGGVTLDDIAEVIVDVNDKLPAAVLERLNRLGIPVSEYNAVQIVDDWLHNGEAAKAITALVQPSERAVKAAERSTPEMITMVAEQIGNLESRTSGRYYTAELKKLTDAAGLDWEDVQLALRDMMIDPNSNVRLMSVDDLMQRPILKQQGLYEPVIFPGVFEHGSNEIRQLGVLYTKPPSVVSHYIEPAMRTYESSVPAIDYDAIMARLKERQSNPYRLDALAIKDGFNPWGLLGDVPQDFRNVLRSANDGVRNTRQVTPEVGDAAHYMATNAQQAYQRIMQQLPELLAGTPNQMTSAQQLRVIDAINALAAKHDDVLAAAVKTGQDVADFAMLNYNQRRNFDVLLQMVIPYHYFWTRSAANWAKRVAQKPAIANFYYEVQRGIDAQNERDNIPQHLQSTIGIPGTDYRIANPLPYMLPFSSYGPSAFVDPNEAETEAGRWINTVVQWSPGLLPTLDFARKYFIEGDVSDVSIGDYIPQYKLAGYAYQGATGNIMPGWGSYTDEFEYGRAGKQVSLANVRGEIDKNTALWGQDVGLQQQTGAKPLPEQPVGAADTWRAGAQASGWDRLLTTGTGYLTGLGVYPYRPEEKQIRAISGIRSDLGYDTGSNLYGSQGAVNAFDETTGEVTDPYYAYRQLYPQGGSVDPEGGIGYYKAVRPGEQAVNAEKKAAKAAISAQMGKDLDEYLKANPDATNGDIYNFKSTYYDQIDALDQKFPSATVYPDRPPVTTDATGYMNYEPSDFYNNYSPEELLAKAQEQAVWQSREELGPYPVYPEGGTKEQEKQYFKDKDAYEAALEIRVQQYLDSPELLSSLVNGRSVLPGPARPGEAFPPAQGNTTAPPLFPELGTVGWDATKIKPVSPGQGATSAADIIRQVDSNGQTAAEQAQREKNAKAADEKRAAGKAKWEQSQAEFAARRANVSGYFGEGGASMWDQYYDLPKGDARTEFMKNNPVMRAINLYAYNRAELQPGLDLLGDDAFGLWSLAPAYADTPEAKAARSAYWDENPKAFLFHSWLNGRSADGAAGGEGFSYNFGQDYQAAQELFGPDIWTIVEGYKRNWGKDIKRNYYDKNPQLSAFFDWWYGGSADGGTVGAASAGRSTGSGGRSYGGGGGGYIDYSEQEYEQPVSIQMPYGRGLSNGLAEGGNSAPASWRPSQADLRWLEAGRNLAPGRPKEGKIDWIRKGGGVY